MEIQPPTAHCRFNRFAADSVIHIRIRYDADAEKNLSVDTRPLLGVLPGDSGLHTRLSGNISPARLISLIYSYLLETVGEPVDFYYTDSPDSNTEDLLLSYYSELLSQVAAKLAIEITRQIVDGPFESQACRDAITRFIKQPPEVPLDQTSLAMINEAKDMGIYWLKPYFHDRLVQYGQGKHAHIVLETLTDRSSALGVSLCRNKQATYERLLRAGLPVAHGLVVTNPEQAIQAVNSLGYPVVVKPLDLRKGIDVYTGIGNERGLIEVINSVLPKYEAVRLERHIAGNDYRVLVMNGKYLAASQRYPAHIVGDGRQTIRSLIDQANVNKDRGTGFRKLMNRIEIDQDCLNVLQVQGYSLDHIPQSGQHVRLKTTANISTGGTARDVTEIIHPDNIELAIRAARLMRLDVSGVDIISPDISQSWKVNGAVICEINTTPGLRSHWIASPEHNLCRLILEELFGAPPVSQIPMLAVTGTVGKTTTTHMLQKIMCHQYERVGLCSTSGVYMNGNNLVTGDFAGRSGTRILVQQPDLDAAVLELARGGLIRHGVEVGNLNIAGITNIGQDHIGRGEGKIKRRILQRG